jgi:hypothetical protein
MDTKKNTHRQAKQAKQLNSKRSKIIDDDFEIMEQFIQENKMLLEAASKLVDDKTPLAKSLDNKKKEDLKNKLKDRVYMKAQMRNAPAKKIINEQTEIMKQMMKHPKMTQEILGLYGNAIAYNPKTKIPSPLDIFNDIDKYQTEYYQYILELLNVVKEQKLNINALDNLLDNPYSHYISKCIGCAVNPFKKSQQELFNEVKNVSDPNVSDPNDDEIMPVLISQFEDKLDVQTDDVSTGVHTDVSTGVSTDVQINVEDSNIKDKLILENINKMKELSIYC